MRFAVVLVAFVGCVYGNSHGNGSSGPDAAPGPHTITVTVSGDGAGFVKLDDGTLCTATSSPCSEQVQDGATATLTWNTPEQLPVWSIQCVPQNMMNPSPVACGIPDVHSDRAVTVTYAKDPHEVATILPTVPCSVGDFLPNGDLIVAGGGSQAVVSRISQQGATIWSTPVSVGTLVSARAGTVVYVLGESDLTAVSLSGAALWTVPVTVPSGAFGPGLPSMLATTPDGNVALVGQTDVEVRSQVDGSVVWSSPATSVQTLAVDGSGNVAAYRLETILRFDSNGNPLTSFPLPAPNPNGSQAAGLAFDSQGGLYALTNGNLTHFDSAGSATSSSAPTQAVPQGYLGATIGLDDQALVTTGGNPMFDSLDAIDASPTIINSFSSSPTVVWTVTKADVIDEPAGDLGVWGAVDGLFSSDVACTTTGLCAIFGWWAGDPASTGYWIELFQQ